VISCLAVLSLIWGFFRAQQRKIDLRIALDLFLVILVAAFIGARSFHVLYESRDYYWKNPLEVLYFWQGGFVYFGGLLGAMGSGILFLKLRKQRTLGPYFDLMAPIAAFSYSLGRWSCFFAGCCYGKHCDLPWALDGRHPTQLYAFAWEFINGLFILFLERRELIGFDKSSKLRWIEIPGAKFCLWLIFHCVGRIIMENFRSDERGPIYFVSISTWISLALLLGAVLSLIKLQRQVSRMNSRSF